MEILLIILAIIASTFFLAWSHNVSVVALLTEERKRRINLQWISLLLTAVALTILVSTILIYN